MIVLGGIRIDDCFWGKRTSNSHIW